MTQIEAVAKGKPEPVISGPSQADGIARFAARAKYDDLTAGRRERLKVSVLDERAVTSFAERQRLVDKRAFDLMEARYAAHAASEN